MFNKYNNSLVDKNSTVAELKKVSMKTELYLVQLTEEEKAVATVLINDGWYGTFDELIECVKNLNEGSDNMCCEISHKCDCKKEEETTNGGE